MCIKVECHLLVFDAVLASKASYTAMHRQIDGINLALLDCE